MIVRLIFEFGIGTGKLHLGMSGHGGEIHVGSLTGYGKIQLQFMTLDPGGLHE